MICSYAHAYALHMHISMAIYAIYMLQPNYDKCISVLQYAKSSLCACICWAYGHISRYICFIYATTNLLQVHICSSICHNRTMIRAYVFVIALTHCIYALHICMSIVCICTYTIVYAVIRAHNADHAYMITEHTS